MKRSTTLLFLFSLAFSAGCNKKQEEAPASKPAAPAETAEPAPPTAAESGERGAGATAAPTPGGAAAEEKGIPAPEDVAAPPKDAKKTASGLVSRVLTPGTGKEHPTDQDRVKVHYSGWTKDGKMFDSSVMRKEPTTFAVTQVIPGWTEALKLMVTGEKRRVWIPGKLAYGDTPRMGAPSGDLTFDVELLEILASPKPPEDVKAAPAAAKKTASGLAFRVLTKGTGKVHPKPTDRVTVHYSGWTTDGQLFDSSVQRGEPATFALNAVVKGWTEGVQLMVQGEKTRFWIPAALGYGESPRPGAPAGTLVFDIELLQIR